MSRFRGIGDDALDVMKQQNQESIQRAQLAEQARSNRRRESIQAAQLSEQARVADNELDARRSEAGLERESRERQAGEERELRSSEAALERESRERLSSAELDARRSEAGLERDQKAGQFGAEYGLKKKMWDRNEEIFQRQKKTWEDEEAQRKEKMEIADGAFSSAIRAALFSPAVPRNFISELNRSLGLPDDAEGAVTKMFKVVNKDGFSDGIAYTTLNKDGDESTTVVSPEQVWGAMSKFSPESQQKVADMYRDRFRQNDKMNLAFQNYLKDLMKQTAITDRANAGNATKKEIAEGGNAVKLTTALSDPVKKAASGLSAEDAKKISDRALEASGIKSGADTGDYGIPSGARSVTITADDGEARDISVDVYRELMRQNKIPAGYKVTSFR